MGRLLVVLGFIALTVLAFLCVNKHTPRIEDDLITRAKHALMTGGVGYTKVGIDGRDLILTGIAPNEVSRERAVELASTTIGVRSVNNQITLSLANTAQSSTQTSEKVTLQQTELDSTREHKADSLHAKDPQNDSLDALHTAEFNIEVEESDPIPTYMVKAPQPLDSQPAQKMPSAIENYQTEIIYDFGKIVLKGHVPDQSARVWLTDLAIEKYAEENVTDLMTVATGEPQSWYSAVSTSLRKLALFEKGKAVLSGSKMLISGQVSSTELKSKIEKVDDNVDTSKMGISYDITTPAGKTSVSDSTTKTCQQKFNNLLKNNQILFDFGQADIKLESYVLLDRLAYVAIKECSRTKLEIAGHTDDQGDESYNQYLSELRAKAVVKYLQEKGVASKNLKAVGYGELRPLVDNSTEKGMTKNRRIEFNVQRK